MKHRVLVIGSGSIGLRHARCFLATERAEVTICERNDSVRQQVADQLPIAAAHALLDDALATKPDIAVVAVPADQHIGVALACAEAQAHLMIEKPLSTSEQQVDALQHVIQQRQLPAMVAYTLRSHPAIVEMRSAIRDGQFGSPLQVYGTSGQHFPTYRPAYREIYYRDRRTGGGAIQDAMTHLLNAAEWMVGPIDRLVADAQHCRLEDVAVEDTVHVIARHGHVMGSYTLNQHQAPNETSLTVVCHDATVRYEANPPRWRWLSKPDGEWQTTSFDRLQRDDLYIRQAHTMMDVVEGIVEPVCTLEEARQTLRVNLGVLRSSDQPELGWQNITSLTGPGALPT